MAKKHKKSLQDKLKKRQQLQQLQTNTAVPASLPMPSPMPAIQAPKPVLALEADHFSREVFHTLISFVVIVGLLIVAIVIDHKTPYLQEFGSWLYQALRLNS